MSTQPGAILERGYAALEQQELSQVQAIIEEARSAGVEESDPRIGYLGLMAQWLDQEAEIEVESFVASATKILAGSVTLAATDAAGRITLDVSDLLAEIGELDEAELALRKLCTRDDLSAEVDGEARLLWAQILLDHQEDPQEADKVLQGVAKPLHSDLGFVSLRAAILIELGQRDEAVSLLEGAIEADDDVELRYQLGLVLREAGKMDEAMPHLLAVRTRDIAHAESDTTVAVSESESGDLCRQLEDILDTLPNPALSKLGSARVEVQRWASEDHVRAGADPRTSVAFTGTPKTDATEGSVDAITIFRDSIVAQIESDEEIADILVLGLVEEVERFFSLELVPGS